MQRRAFEVVVVGKLRDADIKAVRLRSSSCWAEDAARTHLTGQKPRLGFAPLA